MNDTSVTIDDTMPSARPWESEAYEVMSAWIRWSGLSTGAVTNRPRWYAAPVIQSPPSAGSATTASR